MTVRTIMAAVPLGLIGVLIGLYVTGWALGFMAMVGVLSLGGIVINCVNTNNEVMRSCSAQLGI